MTGAYHGHTGLALAAGDERAAESFLSEGAPGEFVQVPFDDLEALERELAAGDVAAVILETVPATVGFPLAVAGLPAPASARCATSAGRSTSPTRCRPGWAAPGRCGRCERAGVVPDVLVCGKGLSGGLYPIAATLLSERAGRWLEEDGWGHVSTFGGAEVGCRVGTRGARHHDARRARGTASRRSSTASPPGSTSCARRHPDRLVEVRQTGLVIGLRLRPPAGRHAHDQGAARRRASGRCSPGSTPRSCSSSRDCSWTTRPPTRSSPGSTGRVATLPAGAAS